MLSRRQFIKAGLAGSVALVLARALYGPFERQRLISADSAASYKALNANEQTIAAAIAPVMLAGALPEGNAVPEIVRGVDQAIAGLPPSVQDEIHQLFTLLQFPVTRRLVAGVGSQWLDASRGEIASFLESWRGSSMLLLRSGYQALHELITAAWYGNATAWPRIGYPGPPDIGR